MQTVYSLMAQYVTDDELTFIGAIDTDDTIYATKEDAESTAELLTLADVEFEVSHHPKHTIEKYVVWPVTVI